MRKFIVLIALLFVCACGGGGGNGGGGGGGGGDGGGGDGGGGGGGVTVSSDITTAEYLKAMSQDCSMDFFLKADIIVDEPWIAVCDSGYTGTFDGGGYTISFNNNITGGLFAKLGTDGSVKNVKINISSQGSIDGATVALAADPNGSVFAFGSVAALAAADSGSIENCIVNIDNSITSADYTGGITGYGGNISKSYVIINGSIHSGKYVGGISGYGDSIINCFAVITGDIGAISGGYVGGIAAYGVTLANNIALVDMGKIDTSDNNGNIFGVGGTGSGTGNNHAYRSTYIDAKNGKNFSLASLFFIEWWKRAGFDEPDWYLGQDKLPLQKVFYDKGFEPDDIWLFIESVSTEIVDNLPNGFACNNDYTLKTNLVVAAEWIGLCNIPNDYKGIFDGDNYTIIFKEDVNGGLLASTYNSGGIVGTLLHNLNIVALKNINAVKVDYTNVEYVAGGAVAHSGGAITDVFVYARGDITAGSGLDIGHAGGLAGWFSGEPLSRNYAVVDGNINATASAGGVAGYAGGKKDNNAAIIGGNIISGGAGGVAGYSTENIVNSLAVASGEINGSTSAGGVAGTNTFVFRNCVAVVDVNKIISPYDDNKGNIWGTSANPGNTNNYIFTPGGTGYTTPDGQNGQSISAVNLKSASWWQLLANSTPDRGPAFESDVWHLEDGYVPLLKSLYDRGIPPNTFPDWVSDN